MKPKKYKKKYKKKYELKNLKRYNSCFVDWKMLMHDLFLVLIPLQICLPLAVFVIFASHPKCNLIFLIVFLASNGLGILMIFTGKVVSSVRFPFKVIINNLHKYELLPEKGMTIEETTEQEEIMEFLQDVDKDLDRVLYSSENRKVLITKGYLLLPYRQLILPRYKIAELKYIKRAGNRWNLYYDKIFMHITLEGGMSLDFFIGEEKKDSDDLINKLKSIGII